MGWLTGKNIMIGARGFLVRSVVEIGVFSAFINLLLLVVPLYLLQVYDRVLPSSSTETLIFISLFALGALLALGALEIVRTLYAGRVALRLDKQFGADALLTGMNSPYAVMGDVQPLRNLATIRQFVGSRVLFSLFDLPFAPFFIALLYLIHPVLFYVTLGGAAIMVGITFLNQLATKKSGVEATESLVANMNLAQSFTRNFETVRALGMVSNVVEHWGAQFGRSLKASGNVSTKNAYFGSISRTSRMLLQIAVLGVGAYLVLQGEMTAGMIFAASIISGRALQPLDQVVGGWRQIIDAKRAFLQLDRDVHKASELTTARTSLPPPEGAVSVENLVYYAPGADMGAQPFIKQISFSIAAGEAVAVIGSSRAGKSTLARLIVGALKPHSGTVRLDGADISHMDTDRLGAFLGYLSQDVELFPGTIAQNVARFTPDVDSDLVVAAAERAHAHKMIMSQPQGYDTIVGPTGVRLSGGERQRIGLARAMFGEPRFLVLDEPNAHLDTEGEQALSLAIRDAKAAGTTVLLITHRSAIAMQCDRVLLINSGKLELYGPAKDVFEKLSQGKMTAAAKAAPAAKPATGNANTGLATFGPVMRAKVK